MNIVRYQKFLEEIIIKGNPAIPGEDDEELKRTSPYLSEIEKEEKAKLGITGAQTPGSIGSQLMSLLPKSNSFIIEKDARGNVIADHRKELEDLAKKVMEKNYSWVINRYDIELDIKFMEARNIKSFLEESENEEDDEESQQATQEFIEVSDEDIRNEVHKRKIANLIIQGEAKNTKHILHSPEVKDGLKKIYGEAKAKEIFELWDKITKLADKLDWIMPTQARAQMMMANPDGLAGGCGYGWNKTEAKIQKEEEEKEEEEEWFPEQEEEEEEEYTEWTGGDEEEMYGDDIFGEDYDDFEPQKQMNYTPILRSRGVDFPMLLHESVKGLFELLSLGGIPEDPKTAEIVVSETGIMDEPEDWKYGPRIAADFRKFVQVNRKWDNHPNIKEELFKLMFDKKTMPTVGLLKAFRGILAYSMPKDHPQYEKLAKDIPFARTTVNRLIDEVIENIEEELKYQKELAEYEKEMEEYNRKMKEWEERQRKKSQGEIQKQTQVKAKEKDEANLSPEEIDELIDDALAKRDFKEVDRLTNLPNYKR